MWLQFSHLLLLSDAVQVKYSSRAFQELLYLLFLYTRFNNGTLQSGESGTCVCNMQSGETGM